MFFNHLGRRLVTSLLDWFAPIQPSWLMGPKTSQVTSSFTLITGWQKNERIGSYNTDSYFFTHPQSGLAGCITQRVQDSSFPVRGLARRQSATPTYSQAQQFCMTLLTSLTRLRRSGTSSLFLSFILPVSSFNSSLKTFLFSKTVSSVPVPPDIRVRVCVVRTEP